MSKSFNGVINIFKEKGYTSFDAVAIVRKTLSNICGYKVKVGHTGTLDPNAEGVLPICIGRGTKFVDEIMNYDKVYKAELFLGFETDTLDVTGEKKFESKKMLSKEDITNCILSFVGTYAQKPPMYSAIKVNGQKMYDLARQGKEVDLKSRTVTINNIEILEVDEVLNKATFIVYCKKGTYIRSLCRDIGIKLGTYGTMGNLLRIATSSFNIENSVKVDEIRECKTFEDVEKYMINIENLLNTYEKVTISNSAIKFIQNGNKLNVKFSKDKKNYEDNTFYKLFTFDKDGNERFLGVYTYIDEFFVPNILYDIEV
ncbi:MAG: tRNA pseudouridine(55) synthase TruB [Lachnospirales bacterium]